MSDAAHDSRAHLGADGEHDLHAVRLFGFWVYIMSDCILFASLFVTYAVLHASYAGGPTGKDIFSLPGVLIETMCLLASSFTYGLATLAMKRGGLSALPGLGRPQPSNPAGYRGRARGRRNEVVGWLAATFVLGAAFVGLEAGEFRHLILEGNGPQRSAFLSAFFTLVGTHGLHVSCGLLWMLVLAAQILRKGLTATTNARVMTLSLFWHFLDIVWICVFTFVYLMGAM